MIGITLWLLMVLFTWGVYGYISRDWITALAPAGVVAIMGLGGLSGILFRRHSDP